MRLLNISTDNRVPQGLKGAHYAMLEEYHKHWDSIDIMVPYHPKAKSCTLFGNVHFHVVSNRFPHPKLFHSSWILEMGERLSNDRMPDIITLHEGAPYYNSFGAFKLAEKLDKPLVAEYFHIPGHPQAASLKEWVYKWFTKINLRLRGRGPSLYRVMNKFQVGKFLIENGINENKIRLIEAIYLDLEVFKERPQEKIYDLVICGNLEPNKGHAQFIEGVKKLSREFPTIRALVIGDGSLKKILKTKVEALGLESNIELYGWAKDSREVAGLFQRSRICVCMSYNEGGPRFTLEAMACGLPVISTRVGLMPEYLNDGLAGMLVDLDAGDMCAAVARLLSDSRKIRLMSQSARKKVCHLEKTKKIKAVADAFKSIATDYQRHSNVQKSKLTYR